MAASESRALSCHPSTPAKAVKRVEAAWARDREVLHLGFRVEADAARLRIPPPSEARLTIGLWEHTCFEAFVAVDVGAAYHEINLSPSGEWAVFAFAGYREIAPLPQTVTAPSIEVRQRDAAIELHASVRLDGWSPIYAKAALRLALAAVLEAEDGTLSYWALYHPPGKADFHHADAFQVRLPRVS